MWGSMRRAGAAVRSLWGDRQVYDRPGQAGAVGHRGMQGERGWCQGQDEGHALTRVCSSESPVSAAMRHSVVGSGCLFTLQKWYSRISSCSSVGITGFSMAISSWGRAMGPGTAERAWCHCSSWEWPVGATLAEPQICHPYPHQPPPPTPAVASGCSRAQLPSQRHAREFSWEHQPPATPVSSPHCSEHTAAMPSAELSHHPQLAGSCRLLSTPLVLYL